MKALYELSQFSLLNYRENPRAKTRSELILLRKQENLSKSVVFDEKVHVPLSKRVEYREKKFINHSFFSENPYKILQNQQKTRDLLNLEQKFPLKACGIHSDILPKFFDIREKIFQNVFKEQNTETEDFIPKKLNFSKNLKKSTENETIINKYNYPDIVELKNLTNNGNFLVETYKKTKKSDGSSCFKKKQTKVEVSKKIIKQKTIQGIFREKTMQGLMKQKTIKDLTRQKTMIQPVLAQSKTSSTLQFLSKKELRTTGFLMNLA